MKANLAGESWLGLDKLHRLTSEASFGLKIVLTDFDGKQFTAHYDRFRVRNRLYPIKTMKLQCFIVV